MSSTDEDAFSSCDEDETVEVEVGSDGTDYGEIKILMKSLENLDSSTAAAEAPLPEHLDLALQKTLSRSHVFADTNESTNNINNNNNNNNNNNDESYYSEQTKRTISLESAYGHPLSPEEAERRVPPGEGGLIWHSLLINGDPFDAETGTLKPGLNPRDFDLERKTIKPRRSSLPVLAKDFYSSLTRVDVGTSTTSTTTHQPRYIFHGVLNGWPSLQTFEVIKIQRRRRKTEKLASFVINPMDIMSGEREWKHMWSANVEGKQGIDPTIREKGLIFRISFRSPTWSREGWSETNPGFAFWYESQLLHPNKKLTYGIQMISSVDPTPKCTHVHMVAHRYAQLKETARDRLTYHSLVLLEWDHGNYCSVVEAAYLNGLAGWRGRSNFFEDLDQPITEMYKHFPPEMVCPWLTNAAEIRVQDIPVKSLQEFKAFVQKYEGPDKRFVDPQYCFSHPVRLTYNSKKDIAQYLNNYIRRDVTYSQLRRNCQTMAADLCAFLAGKREVLPYHPVNRIEYTNRSYLFLYQPNMYEQDPETTTIQANRLRG